MSCLCAQSFFNCPLIQYKVGIDLAANGVIAHSSVYTLTFLPKSTSVFCALIILVTSLSFLGNCHYTNVIANQRCLAGP